MEEIRIYRSPWKSALLVIICFAFTAGSLFMLKSDESISLINRIILWMGVILFGVGGCLMLYITLRGWFADVPFILITNESVTLNNHKSTEYRYADIKAFRLCEANSAKFIAVDYKKDVDTRKLAEASKFGQTVRKLNIKISGAQEAIPVDQLTLKPDVILEILNENLAAYNKKARG